VDGTDDDVRRAGGILSNRGIKSGVSMMHLQVIPLAPIIQLQCPAVDTVRTDYPSSVSNTDPKVIIVDVVATKPVEFIANDSVTCLKAISFRFFIP